MRVLVRVAYDGTNYSGWQRQDNAVTVQETVEDALSDLLQEQVSLTGGSRTDAGVHSFGNPAVFDTETRIPAAKLARAVNTRLPEDIRVMSSAEVPADFDLHRALSRKTYEYRIWNGSICPPALRLYCCPVHVPLDADAMQTAGSCLVGEHDFTSFSSVHAQVRSRVRTLYEVQVTEQDETEIGGGIPGHLLAIRVTGNGFLYNMVRIIAGTLIDVGRGQLAAEDVCSILAGCDRSLAGPTAPPQGLFHIRTEFNCTDSQAPSR